MATSTVTRAQFDAALEGAVTTLKTKLDDLGAKVAAGQVQTPEDFTAELNMLQSAVNEALTIDPDTITAPSSADTSSTDTNQAAGTSTEEAPSTTSSATGTEEAPST